MTRVLMAVIGPLTEAWIQVRINRLRVLLSLVGVAAAVAAMTFIIAFGQVTESIMRDTQIRFDGRPGTVIVTIDPSGHADDDRPYIPNAPGGEDAVDSQPVDLSMAATPRDTSQAGQRAALASLVERYSAPSWNIHQDATARIQTPGGVTRAEMTIVSPGYGTMHRLPLGEGRWLSASDAADASPSVVISGDLADVLGITSLTHPVRVQLFQPVAVTVTIVGVLDNRTAGSFFGQQLNFYVLEDSIRPWLDAEPAAADRLNPPSLELWAGEGGPDRQLAEIITADVEAMYGPHTAHIAFSSEENSGRKYELFTLVVTSAGVLIMLVGALSLVNISLVTVRQRIREIGVRRSFGATSRRIFVSIMLESVVATVVAGLVGVIIAIIAMRYIPMNQITGLPVVTRPPFPMSAALIGLLSATVVGALAGIIPGMVAMRIKPIDAIRY